MSRVAWLVIAVSLSFFPLVDSAPSLAQMRALDDKVAVTAEGSAAQMDTVYSTSTGGWWSEPWNALKWNLAAEIIGILVAVFLVDRLITAREKRRWKPSRDIAYARIVKAVGEFLLAVQSPPKTVVGSVFNYGSASAFAYGPLRPSLIVDLLSEFEARLVSGGSDALRDAIVLLRQLHGKLDNVLKIAAGLLAADDMNMLAELDAGLDGQVRVVERMIESGSDKDAQLAVWMLGSLVKHACDLAFHLQKKADSITALGDHLVQLRSKMASS